MSCSNELRDFVIDCGYTYKNNCTTDNIPVIVEIRNKSNSIIYSTTMNIEDRFSNLNCNILVLNSEDVKQILNYRSFSSNYNNFEYENRNLRFQVKDYQIIIIPNL